MSDTAERPGLYHVTAGPMHHEDDCTPECPLNGLRDDYGAFGRNGVSFKQSASAERAERNDRDMTEEPFSDFAIPRRVPTGDVAWKLPIRIPVSDEDLADAGPIDPYGIPMSGQSVIQTWLDTHQQRTPEELADEREARKVATEEAQVVALAEWEALRAKFTDTPQGATLRELLNVHQPELYTYAQRGPVCGYCDQIGGPEREGVNWPCVNYEIIRDGMG